MSLENVRYDAFISYRHCELDSFISENLHKKLESYKIPSSVLKKLSPEKTRIERIFRDEAELPLSGNLSDPITAALDNSEFLIVICTPRLRESQWCLKEIETFVAKHDREHVLLVLAEGEPDESFPQLLLHEDVIAKDASGNDITVKVDREPLAADCRADNNRERLKLLDNVVLKLCAAMFGLNYDDLRQRHHERQVRRRMAIAGVAFTIVTVFALTCLGFMIKISNQSRVIADKYAGAMASASQDLMSRGLAKDAVYAARSVLPDNGRDYNADALYALTNALAPYETASSYYPDVSFKIPDGIRYLVPDGNGHCIVYCDDECILIDTATSAELLRIDGDFAHFLGDDIIYIDPEGNAVLTDASSSKQEILAKDAIEIYTSPSNDIALIITYDGITLRHRDGKSSDLSLGPWWDGADNEVLDIYFTRDGDFAAFALSSDDGVHTGVIDLGIEKVMLSDDVDYYEEPSVATDGETLYLYYDEETDDGVSAVVTATDIATQTVIATRRLSGSGFYNMICDQESVLVVSDRLAYVLDNDLNDIDVISGYMDAVCAFGDDSGYVLLDRTGSLFSSGVFSTDERCLELYAHDEGFVSHAYYLADKDSIYIHYKYTDRISVYERLQISDYVTPENGESDPADAMEDPVYLDNAGEYISDLMVHDSDDNIIARLPQGIITGKVSDDNSVIITSLYTPGKLYRIKPASYDEILDMADKMLNGYVPDEDIRDRYNIN